MSAELAVIVAFLTAVGSIITAWSTRKKMSAEADASLTGSAMNMVREMRAELDIVKKENIEQRKELDQMKDRMMAQDKKILAQDKQIAQLLSGITLLHHQIKAKGEEPLWSPEDMKEEKHGTIVVPAA